MSHCIASSTYISLFLSFFLSPSLTLIVYLPLLPLLVIKKCGWLQNISDNVNNVKTEVYKCRPKPTITCIHICIFTCITDNSSWVVSTCFLPVLPFLMFCSLSFLLLYTPFKKYSDQRFQVAGCLNFT